MIFRLTMAIAGLSIPIENRKSQQKIKMFSWKDSKTTFILAGE
jgi:hypothetical protein